MPAQRVRLLSNNPSDGLKALSDALKARGIITSRCRNETKPTKPALCPTVKWGCFSAQTWVREYSTTIMNGGSSDTVLNKLQCLDVLTKKGVPAVEFTTEKPVVAAWLTNGDRVYVRSILRGSGGEGITVLEGGVEIPDAPLYTRGIKGKRREYRIHVFNHNGVKRFWIQQKLRRSGFQDNSGYDNKVRNLENGWVFAHNNIQQPKEQTIGAAVSAIESFGLNFGAVDIIEVDKGGAPFVLEINTAPGLEGSTVDFYASCIEETLKPNE